MSQTIYIKSMVCVRCKMAVESALRENALAYSTVELGWAKLDNDLTPQQQKALEESLSRYELALVKDRTLILVERIKAELHRILQPGFSMQFKLSVHLSELLQYNYTYLANTFSEVEGVTLERYFISQRIEAVKVLLIYEELSLAQICEQLNFSSVSHLCQQFKKVAGFTPAEYKKQSCTENFVWKSLEHIDIASNGFSTHDTTQ